MKKLGILLLACITALNLSAEKFKIGKFTFEIETPTTVELHGADKDITNVFLSETIDYKGNSYTITSIGGYAFAYCKSLKSVTIPNSVTSIGGGAFTGCESLTSVTIPNSVTSIGSYAFLGTALYANPANWGNGALYINNCLIKVDEGFAGHFRIKENTRVIAMYAFPGCTSLTSVTIPNSVTSIGEGAFASCSSLTSMVVASDNSTYDSRDNCNAIIETATNTLIAGCQSTTIPNSVTSIGEKAFVGCRFLTSVTIPNSVTSIEYDAFKGTALYNNPANWENGALYINNCLIKVDKGFVGHFRIKENTRVIASWAFWGCSALTSVTIPNSVTSIGHGAFPEHTQIIRP